MEQRIVALESRVEKIEDRQSKLEEAHQKHREEFIETRTYVKESYGQLKEIRLGIESLKQHTSERIEQQGRYYRDELKALQKTSAASIDGEESKRTYDFAWKVIAGILALATTVLGILQAAGGAGH